MKKLLFIFCCVSLMACEPKLEQTNFTITKIESISESDLLTDSAKMKSRNFCHYGVNGNDHVLTIIDSVGKFQIGDTIVFGKRIINVVDTTNINIYE